MDCAARRIPQNWHEKAKESQYMQTPPAPLPPHPATPDWRDAPGPDWNWLAQDADGQWFWYRTEPQLGWAGGIWRSNSRHQHPAGQGTPTPDWANSLQTRPT